MGSFVGVVHFSSDLYIFLKLRFLRVKFKMTHFGFNPFGNKLFDYNLISLCTVLFKVQKLKQTAIFFRKDNKSRLIEITIILI